MIKKIAKFGLQIDSYSDSKDIIKLTNVIKEIESFLSKNELNNNELIMIYYFLGNAWSSLDKFSNYNNHNSWMLKRNEFDNSIINYRKAKQYIKEDSGNNNSICMLLTNLANGFSHMGRPIEAIRVWNQALRLDKNFKMALGNKGQGYFEYSKMMYDPSHRDIMGREAYKYLSTVKEKEVHPSAFKIFNTIKISLSNYFNKDYLEKNFIDEEYSLGKNEDEKGYWQWVLENSLFLNPLNDLFKFSIVAHDILSLPSMTIPNDISYNDPIYHRFFNQIKQEFLSLRYFFYQYSLMDESDQHFSDNNRHLVNTLDYPQYGLKYEYLKISFRMAYSLFDKIAYFLNQYLELEIPDYKVSFKNIWYPYDKNKKRFLIDINEKIINLKNLPLRGLYFLSKDFYEQSYESQMFLEPKAKNIAKIRNFIEHKSLIIYWDINGDIEKEALSYQISETNFSEKCWFLLKTCREAIIYLSLAVHSEERKNEDEGFYMPIFMPEYDY